jgi:hypothetical protein
MTKWIKKFAASAAIAGALASGAVLASGPASADIYSDRAHAVCEHLDHGATVSHLNRLYHQIWRQPQHLHGRSALRHFRLLPAVSRRRRCVGQSGDHLMATITISITDVHMDGHDDTEREVQACVEDSVGMIEAAIEDALSVNCLEGDVTVDIES